MNIHGYDYISDRDFVDNWGAHAKPTGGLYFYDEVRSLPCGHVWTVTEGEELDEDGFNVDGSWYATPGLYVINALGYLTSERPWGTDTPDAVWFLDDDDEAREERRADFLANR